MPCGGDSDTEPSGDVPRPEPVRRAAEGMRERLLAGSRSRWGRSRLHAARKMRYRQGHQSRRGQGEGQLPEDAQGSEGTGRGAGEQRWRGLRGSDRGRAWSPGEAAVDYVRGNQHVENQKQRKMSASKNKKKSSTMSIVIILG